MVNRGISMHSQAGAWERDDIAQYLTVLPPKELLESKLHQALENARKKFPINE